MSESEVRQQYDQIAASYDQRWSKYVTDTLSFLKTWAEIPPQANVLDVACGTGKFEQMVLAENPRQKVTGVDISENMLAIAQQNCSVYPNASFHSASVLALPFSDCHFDVIVSASAFHYFDQPQAALIEIKRVLNLDGKVVILDWCKDYFLCRICDILLKIFDPAHRQCYTQKELHNLLTDAGFKIHHARKVRFGVVWGLMVVTAIVERSEMKLEERLP